MKYHRLLLDARAIGILIGSEARADLGAHLGGLSRDCDAERFLRREGQTERLLFIALHLVPA